MGGDWYGRRFEGCMLMLLGNDKTMSNCHDFLFQIFF